MTAGSAQKVIRLPRLERPAPQDSVRDFQGLSAQQKEQLVAWLKPHRNHPEGLLVAIAQTETPVAMSAKLFEPIMTKLFMLMGLRPGFIAPAPSQPGFQLLCAWLRVPFEHAARHGLFWISTQQHAQPSMSFLIHQCYHWQAFKAGLEGYTPEAQSIYQKFWGQHHGLVSNSLLRVRSSVLRQLQAAIRRDTEALQLVGELALQRF